MLFLVEVTTPALPTYRLPHSLGRLAPCPRGLLPDSAKSYAKPFWATCMVDHTVRSTDAISYFDEAQHYTIKTHPERRGDVGRDVIETLCRQTWPVERFEYVPGETASYDEYFRLRFGGFEIRRIANRMAQRQIQPAQIIAWSLWRRAHQAAARQAHTKPKTQL